MRRLRALLIRCVGLFAATRRDRAFDEELQSHLAMHVDDNLRAGMTPEAARRDALMKLGGVMQTREAYRDRRGLPVLDHIAQDLRFALRTLRKSPTFAIIVILTLGLGIGANAAIFSIINAVLLRPLPYPDANRLAIVWATNGQTGHTEYEASFPDFEDWKAQSRSFDEIVAFTMFGATMGRGDHAERLPAIQVTHGFFEMLGYAPALGRTFRSDDEQPGSRVVILSDALWTYAFDRRAGVLGETIRLNEQTYTIIGVMRPDVDFATRLPDERELYLPLVGDTNRNHASVQTLARLRPGVSIRQAQADMDVITRRLAAQYPASNAQVGANVMPLVYARVGHFRTRLLVFMGVAALVLLIACTNVANLLLARNVSRQKELAMRVALGAGRLRLLQQLMTESLVLALTGGALGVLIATWTAPVLAALLAKNFLIARLEQTRTDVWVLAFAFVVSLATVLLFGAVHAQGAASTIDLQESLRASGRAASEGARGTRLRRILVISEVAMALVLLAGAGSLLRSLLVMGSTAPGLATDHVLTAELSLPKSKLTNTPVRLRFFQDLLARIATLPQARSAALVSDLPLSGSWYERSFRIIGTGRSGGSEGSLRPGPDAALRANVNIASAGYFQTLGIPVTAGRELTAQDTANTPRVAVINETAARRFWPGEDPVGAQIVLEGESAAAGASPSAPQAITVVGVTGDVRQMGLGRAVHPEIFLSYMQQTGRARSWLTLVVRTTTDPAAAAVSIKSLAQSVDRDVPVTAMHTLDEVLNGSLAPPRVYTSLLGTFATLALLLAAVGLYGVMSYTVSQRTHEMGIRMALGAGRGDVIRLVLRQALGLVLIGTAIGLAGALAAARLLTHLVPAAQPSDPLTLAAVSAVLIAAACLASYAPARRGSRVDPMIAVRDLH
jgi:putative ABC transport system permease protein